MSGLRRVQSFVEDRRRLGDWAEYCSADMTRLSRAKLIEACGIKRSLIYQNSKIVALLRDLESELTSKSIIGSHAVDTYFPNQRDSCHGEEIEHRLVSLSTSLCEFDQYLNGVGASLLIYPLPRSK